MSDLNLRFVNHTSITDYTSNTPERSVRFIVSDRCQDLSVSKRAKTNRRFAFILNISKKCLALTSFQDVKSWPFTIAFNTFLCVTNPCTSLTDLVIQGQDIS